MTHHALAEGCEQRDEGETAGWDWPPCQHLESKTPEGCHKCSSLPEGHSSIPVVSTTIHQCVSPQPWLTCCWLINQWDWPSPSVSTAWGASSPRLCNEMLSVSWIRSSVPHNTRNVYSFPRKLVQWMADVNNKEVCMQLQENLGKRSLTGSQKVFLTGKN